ncbi:MAG: pyrroline-5-carboxylate reductase [Clostridia bacterium]|nr:pyrroline-5-carboxylate reductase [Clostridia bacterium]
MKRTGLFVVLCISVCMLMGGCGNDSNQNTEESTIAVEENTTVEETTESAEKPEGPRGNGGGNGGGNRGGAMMSETDPELLAVIEENADKFEQFSYTDEETGITLEYSLYIPENYDENTSYPLLMYIPDSTGAGKSAAEIVEQYYGADVWVTEEEQEKHASFVFVPAFTETVVDDNWTTSEQIEVVVKIIESLSEQYHVDENRIYATGQSMGCMTSLYLNSKYPDLFAASLFVSGQWDISVLQGLEDKKFFYITAGGDTNASGGQDEVKAMFDTDGVSYSYGTWNAQNLAEEQNAAVETLLSEGNQANMIRFEAGTVFKEGESGMEHMASFNYAYKITAVRDWLYEQTK